DLDRVVVEVRTENVRRALAEGVVDPGRVVDVHAEAVTAGELDGEHLDAGEGRLDQARNVAPEQPFLLVLSTCHLSPPSPSRLHGLRSDTKSGRRAPTSTTARNVVAER